MVKMYWTCSVPENTLVPGIQDLKQCVKSLQNPKQLKPTDNIAIKCAIIIIFVLKYIFL